MHINLLLKFIQGMIIGLGGILPGVSGGVLCVIFNIYQDLMELLSDPFKNFKPLFFKLLPYFIGIGCGFIFISKLLTYCLTYYESLSICLFIGLILGMFPSLWKEAKSKDDHPYANFIFVITTLITFLLLISLKYSKFNIEANILWYGFCGIALALSIIVPGLSFSSILMPLNLYTIFIEGISTLNINILIPAAISCIITIKLLSSKINNLFNNHFTLTFHFILGIVLASTIIIIPSDTFMSFNQFISSLIVLIIGIIIALLLDKFNNHIKKRAT